MQRLVKVDGKARTDSTYPAGYQDTITIEKTNEHFRLLYDIRGRFQVHRITADEAKFKLCRVKSLNMGQKGIPYIVTHDGRTIRYPDPLIKMHDVVKLDLETGKTTDIIKFETGNLAMISGGKNTGRVGVIVSREKHRAVRHRPPEGPGGPRSPRLSNVFVIGKGTRASISLPKRKGIKRTILEERALRPPKA